MGVIDARVDATALSMREVLSLIETQRLEPRDIPIVVPLSFIEVDEKFNTRQTNGAYGTPEEMQALVDSLTSEGQQQTMSVMPNQIRAKRPLYLTAGFRRARAFHFIARRDRIDPSVMVVLKAFKGATFFDKLMPAMFANLASDGTVPLRSWDVAQRLHYFRIRLGLSPSAIAKRVGLHPSVVSNYLYCLERLSPDVKRAWASAPSPQYEIPMHRLRMWAQFGYATQKELLERFIDDSDEAVFVEEKGKKKRVDKRRYDLRPKLPRLKKEYARIELALRNAPRRSPEWMYLDGVRRALSFAMGDTTSLLSTDPSPYKHRKKTR